MSLFFVTDVQVVCQALCEENEHFSLILIIADRLEDVLIL